MSHIGRIGKSGSIPLLSFDEVFPLQVERSCRTRVRGLRISRRDTDETGESATSDAIAIIGNVTSRRRGERERRNGQEKFT